MKADVIKAKGLEELGNVEFEVVIDEVTGKARVVLKTPSTDFNNTTFEITVDVKTGKQKIIKRTVIEQDDGKIEFIELKILMIFYL